MQLLISRLQNGALNITTLAGVQMPTFIVWKLLTLNLDGKFHCYLLLAIAPKHTRNCSFSSR